MLKLPPPLDTGKIASLRDEFSPGKHLAVNNPREKQVEKRNNPARERDAFPLFAPDADSHGSARCAPTIPLYARREKPLSFHIAAETSAGVTPRSSVA